MPPRNVHHVEAGGEGRGREALIVVAQERRGLGDEDERVVVVRPVGPSDIAATTPSAVGAGAGVAIAGGQGAGGDTAGVPHLLAVFLGGWEAVHLGR